MVVSPGLINAHDHMGWMNDVLRYMAKQPIHRKYHHDELTFSLIYAFHENFVLPLSHDEVVHGKGSLAGRMPGNGRQMLANLRLLFGCQYTHPGKKLLFMGGEFGQGTEWNFNKALDWYVLDYAHHHPKFDFDERALVQGAALMAAAAVDYLNNPVRN